MSEVHSFLRWNTVFFILMVAKHSTALSTIKSASRVVEMIKNLPEVQETWVQSLRWEDPLEKGTATHPSILAWRIPWIV